MQHGARTVVNFRVGSGGMYGQPAWGMQLAVDGWCQQGPLQPLTFVCLCMCGLLGKAFMQDGVHTVKLQQWRH